MAKAERVDTQQLDLEFKTKLRELETLAGTLGIGRDSAESEGADVAKSKPKKKGTGRRDLRSLPIEERRIEITDPVLEALVADGKATRHGFEESCKLARQRGGMRRVVIARVKYRTHDTAGEATVLSAPMPQEMFPRAIATASLISHVIIEKICRGLPLFRIEDAFSREGVPIDRGTMSRWLEHAGATLGATVVHAMRADAMATAFCIATDATGIGVQPIRTGKGEKGPEGATVGRGHRRVRRGSQRAHTAGRAR